jgi:hypothetical protein
MVNKTLRQALELQAMLLAVRPHKMGARTFWESWSPQPTWLRDTSRSSCWRYGEPSHFRGSCSCGREVENNWHQKRDDRPLRETPPPPWKSEWWPINRSGQEKLPTVEKWAGACRKGQTLANTLNPPSCVDCQPAHRAGLVTNHASWP